MNLEDYFKYYIQGSDHYLIPKDVFKELFNEMINWKEENKQLQEELECTIGIVEHNRIISEKNKEINQLKDNWNELKKWLRIKDILANSKINPQSIKFKDLLKHMEYLEKEK